MPVSAEAKAVESGAHHRTSLRLAAPVKDIWRSPCTPRLIHAPLALPPLRPPIEAVLDVVVCQCPLGFSNRLLDGVELLGQL
jgi:hypothetical protein